MKNVKNMISFGEYTMVEFENQPLSMIAFESAEEEGISYTLYDSNPVNINTILLDENKNQRSPEDMLEFFMEHDYDLEYSAIDGGTYSDYSQETINDFIEDMADDEEYLKNMSQNISSSSPIPSAMGKQEEDAPSSDISVTGTSPQ